MIMHTAKRNTVIVTITAPILEIVLFIRYTSSNPQSFLKILYILDQFLFKVDMLKFNLGL